MVLIICTKNELNLTNRYWDMVPDRQTEGRTEWTDRRTDDAKTISLRLRRGIIIKFRTQVVCWKGLDKQCRPRSEEAVWSRSSLFAILTHILPIAALIISNTFLFFFISEEKEEKSVRNFRTLTVLLNYPTLLKSNCPSMFNWTAYISWSYDGKRGKLSDYSYPNWTVL